MDCRYIDLGYHSQESRIAVLIFPGSEEIIVVDLAVVVFDCRGGEAENPGMEFAFVFQNSTHYLFISLRKQTTSTVINRGDGCGLGGIVIEEAPVSVVTVEVSEKGIYDKHIPEMFQQFFRIDKLLLFNGFQHIIQFCSGSIVARINDGVLDGAEVVQTTAVSGKVFAGADDLCFAAHIVGAQDCLLRGDAHHVKNTAGNMFAETAVGVGQFRSLGHAGGGEL